MYEQFSFSTSLPAFGVATIFFFFNFSHFDSSVVIPHCGLNLHYFPDGWLYWASFQMLICHLYIVFGDVSPQIFWTLVFLFWVLRVFNIFWIWALYLINVFQILSPVCGLSFHSLKSVFCRAGDFNFNEVHTINFFFHRLSWWCYIKGSKMALVFWHKMAQCCYFFSSG